MPLNPTVLAAAIKAALLSQPVGMAPQVTLTPSPKSDGTMDVTAATTSTPALMNPELADVIANAVAVSVVQHLLSTAVVVGACPTGAVTAKIT